MNDVLFHQKVKENGLKFHFISEKLGISDNGLIKKRKGLIPFKVCEINIITDLLRLSASERDDIFDLKSSR